MQVLSAKFYEPTVLILKDKTAFSKAFKKEAKSGT